MKKIKVALLIDEFFGGANTAYGGYGFLAREYICKYIPNNKIQIDVLLERKQGLTKTELNIVDNTNVYRLPYDENLAKDWLKKQNYDLFMSIEMTYPSYEIMKLVENKKLLLWIQDPRPNKLWQKKRNTVSLIKDPCVISCEQANLIRDLNYRGLVKFITQGYSLIPLAQELYNLPENYSVKYVPNPIDFDKDYKFDINKKKKQVIFLGRLEAQKRAWLFCEAAKRMPEYEFYVMGKFFRDEENNKKPLEPYLNNDIPNLHFTGHLEGEEKEKLIKESRILLNTSIWEGIPISWLEAMQYGTAIVSCLDNESIPSRFGKYVGEILGNGYDKVDLFIPAIKELMENDDLYKHIATKEILYLRKNHNKKNFINNLRKLLQQEITRKIVPNYPMPTTYNKIDVKISYACNYKCEYCYQVDENGIRQNGILSHKNAVNLIKFVSKLKDKYVVNLVGGEPFVYKDLEFLARHITKMGHLITIITNFSAPLEKMLNLFKITNNKIDCFSISIHLSQINDLEAFYDKLTKFITYIRTKNIKTRIWTTCVITEENFELAKQVYEKITEELKLPIDIQRFYDKNGIYTIYSDKVEEYLRSMHVDVPIEKANNIDFYGHLCWAGCKFFYIESNGDVRRCYTNQYPQEMFLLGNLSDYKNIRVFDKPMPCLSADNGKCVCWKLFTRMHYYTGIKSTELELQNTILKYQISHTKKHLKDTLKYYSYRIISNIVFGEMKNEILSKKNKYKELLNEK